MTIASTDLLEQPMGVIAQNLPGATAVFHKFKLDFCCGGAHTLREALSKKNLTSDQVVGELAALLDRAEPDETSTEASNEALIEHILSRYHDVHRQQLPELIRLSRRVERVHGSKPACPVGLSAHLETMLEALETHMQKEEGILFPLLAQGVSAAVHPIGVMRMEHDDHAQALARIDALTDGIRLPEGACNTWRALYLGLATFKTDLMNHIHLENNVLFNRFDGRLGGADH